VDAEKWCVGRLYTLRASRTTSQGGKMAVCAEFEFGASVFKNKLGNWSIWRRDRHQLQCTFIVIVRYYFNVMFCRSDSEL